MNVNVSCILSPSASGRANIGPADMMRDCFWTQSRLLRKCTIRSTTMAMGGPTYRRTLKIPSFSLGKKSKTIIAIRGAGRLRKGVKSGYEH